MKQYNINIAGKNYDVEILSVDGANATVKVNGKQYEASIKGETKAAAPRVVRSAVHSAPAAVSSPKAASVAGAVCAPLPGVILSIDVKEGDIVSAGQKLAVLEAMKMENSIEATSNGKVTKVFVQKGDSVLEGSPIVSIE